MTETSILFRLLANPHRRRILLLLCQSDSVRVPEGIKTRGTARTQGQQSSQQFQLTGEQSQQMSSADPEGSLELQLTHRHLPKLESEGLIEWDKQAETVSRGPNFAQIEPILHVFVANAEKFPGSLR